MAGWLLAITSLSAAAGPDFSRVESYLARSVADGVVAGGAVMVLQEGGLVFETGFGFADIEDQEPFRVGTPAIIASISKPVLGTALFRLAAAGKLDSAEPITTFLPEFGDSKLESGDPLARAPTVIELLTHTSGLRNDEAPGGRPWFAEWTNGQALSAVVTRYALEFPFKAQPGTSYAYSGIGTDVAARVAEVVSGKLRNEFLLEQVCRPLGMEHTFYRDSERIASARAMPTRYYRGKDGKLRVAKRRRLPQPDLYSASGGTVVSTAGDLATWLLMIRNQGVHQGQAFLDADLVAEMLRPNKLGKNAHGGLFVRERTADGKVKVVGHTGSSGTNCWIDFETDTIGIMLTQTRSKDIREFRHELEKRVAACISAAE